MMGQHLGNLNMSADYLNHGEEKIASIINNVNIANNVIIANNIYSVNNILRYFEILVL